MPYIIILELCIIIFLAIYISKIRKKSAEVKKTVLKIHELSVTRDILAIASLNKSLVKKFNEINEYLLKNLNVDFSSIVLKEGNDTEILTTNIEEERKEDLKKYYDDEMFSLNLNENKILTMQKEKNNKFKYLNSLNDKISAFIMAPIYIDKKLSGYWLIESENKEKIINLDNKIISSIKETLAEIIKISTYQSALETLVKDDEYTKLKTREYLFSEIKNEMDKFNNSLILMIKINNLKEINKKYGRETGNQIITKVSEIIQKEGLNEKRAVRYYGPKLVVVFPNVSDKKSIIEELKIDEIKKELENIELRKKLIFKAKPEINMAYGIYEKNTRLHKLTEKLENYLDNTKEKDNIKEIV